MNRLSPLVLDGMDRARLTERRRAGLAYLLAARARAGRSEAPLFLAEARAHFAYASRWLLLERRVRQIAAMGDDERRVERFEDSPLVRKFAPRTEAELPLFGQEVA